MASLRSTVTHTADVIYYNASAVNLQPDNVVAEFDDTRAVNVLDKASDYYLAITRFNIQHSTIAIFDFDEDEFYVTIGGKEAQVPYVPRGNPYSTLFPTFRGIYTFQQFLDCINSAFATAHAAAPASPGNPPRFVYEGDDRFSLLVDTLYTEDVFLSYYLFRFFISLDMAFVSFPSAGNANYRVEYGPVYENTFPYALPLVGNYYKMKQESSTLFNWSDIVGIVITSNAIPGQREFIALGNRTGSNEELSSITDFIPIQTQQQGYDRSDWVYNSGSGYRLVSLKSDQPLRTLDFRVNLINKNGVILPLTLAPGESCSVKFMFRIKSMENNEY